MRSITRFSFLLALTSSAALASPDLGHIQSLVAQGPGVLVASDTGLYFAGHDGRIVQRGTRQGGFSALVADRADPQRLYASTPDTPVLRSTNGGRQWQAVSGLGAKPFTILSAGPAGSDILYGVADGIYRSADEGRHWTRSGDLPEKTITVAASPTTAGTLFAGTMTGLVVSRDDGATWTRQSAGKGPTTLVEPGPGGGFLSFAWGEGLSRVAQSGQAAGALNNGFGGQVILHLARNGDTLTAATSADKLFVSQDDGRHWRPLAGYPAPQTAAERHGEQLYTTNCQACHGDHGIGESPAPGKTSLAPALDETAHAWHHTDEQLEKVILEGLPSPSRMPAWSGTLTPTDARDLIAYMKSLWDARALRCQGPKHMSPECRR